MNLKRGLLVFAVVFMLVIGVLIIKSDRFNPSPLDKKDNILPVPSKEFDEWRKQWEKQR